MTRTMCLLSLMWVFPLFLAAEAQPASCQAEVFVFGSLQKKPAVKSPNAHYRVVLLSAEFRQNEVLLNVFHDDKLVGHFSQDLSPAGMFVKWAPDSRAFYFMWSDGGVIGGYSVRVFRVAGDSVREVPATEQAGHDFAKSHYCERGNNTFAIRWLNGSDTLLISIQVYPTGDCGKDMGRYGGYEVRPDDGSIVHRYSERQLKSVWPDGCPSRIWPDAFWDDTKLQQAKQALKNKEQSH